MPRGPVNLDCAAGSALGVVLLLGKIFFAKVLFLLPILRVL
jgi:hypothetical protein